MKASFSCLSAILLMILFAMVLLALSPVLLPILAVLLLLGIHPAMPQFLRGRFSHNAGAPHAPGPESNRTDSDQDVIDIPAAVVEEDPPEKTKIP